MVDCRPAGELPHQQHAPHSHNAHHAPNGANNVQPPDNHHNQTGASGDMGGHGMTPPAARASTPATTTLSTYTGGMAMGANVNAMGVGQGYNMGMGVGCAPYVCGVKSVVWCAPHSPPPHAPHAPPPPPPTVNPHVFKSVQPNGQDLPMNDIPTLRYYFNLGVECMWAAYGPPPPHPGAPRHYSPRDIAQDMQQLSLVDRGVNHSENKHKPSDNKPPLNQNKNQQRALLGPRFKRGNNQDGNQNSNHNQNKGHNNNMGNKGPNNRRNSHTDARNSQHHYGGMAMPVGQVGQAGVDDNCVLEPPLLTLPYIPYPPPLYPIPYYPVESDPAMMGMMGGMGYVGYEEGVEYGPPLQPYYPHYGPAPPHPAHHPHPPAMHHPPPPPPPGPGGVPGQGPPAQQNNIHQEHK